MSNLLEQWAAEDQGLPPDAVAPPPEKLRPALEATADLDAAKAARISQLSKDLELPEGFVIENPYRAEQELKARRIEASPSLAAWAQEDRLNAAHACDDFENLITLEGQLRAVGAEPYSQHRNLGAAYQGVAKFPGVLAESLYQGGAMGLGLLDLAGEKTNQLFGAAGLSQGQHAPVFGAARDWSLEQARNIREGYLESETLSMPEELRGPLWDNWQYLLEPEYLISQFMDAANSLAVMLLGAGAVGGGMKTAASIGGAMEAGSFYDSLIEDGVSNDAALTGAFSFGVVTGLLNKLGLDKMFESPAGQGVLRAVRSRLVAGVTEGTTEYLENPAQAIIEGIVKNEPLEDIGARFLESLTEVDVIPGSFLLGSVVGGGRRRREAREYAGAISAVSQAAEASGTKQLAPGRLQSFLEAASPLMRERVELPAEALLEYYQQGVDLLTPLGLDRAEAERLAALGHSFSLPASSLPAYLDQAQAEAAIAIMRRNPEADNLNEAEEVPAEGGDGAEPLLGARLAADLERVLEIAQQQSEEVNEFDAARQALRANAVQSISAVPGLRAQAESLAGGVEAYVEAWLKPFESFAQRLAASGQNPAALLRKLTLKAAVRKTEPQSMEEIDFASMTPEAAEAAYQQIVAKEIQAELAGESLASQVRGRLDGRSLKRDYPDAYRELVRQYGPGFFRSGNKGGLPLDYLATELVESNVLERGMGADELLERLKMPGRRFFQNEVEAADQALRRDAAAWESSVDAFVEGKLPRRRPVVMLKQTPLVLQMLGAENLPLTTSYGVLDKVINQKHQLAPELVRQIAAAMADPVMVLRSSSEKAVSDVTVMLDLKDEHGSTVVVPVALKKRTGRHGGYEMNFVPSIYVKNDEITKEPREAWFINQITSGNALYVNRKKMEDWIDAARRRLPGGGSSLGHEWARTARLQLPGVGSLTHGYKRVATEADLVKLRELYPTLYQPAYHGSPYKFDKFSLEHLGRGEGNQAYGWGLYFASRKNIADWYRRELSRVKREQGQDVGEGQLYEADIPEDSQMLDWDIPLIGQRHIEDMLMQLPLEERVRAFGESGKPRLGLSGRKIYQALIKDGDMRHASEQLNSVGIKGVRYLDAISNQKGEKKQNYVVFDDRAISILKTYYQNDPDLVGGVTPEMAKFLPLGRAGDIILLPEDLQHIEDAHGGQIRALGYADAREFVNYVLSHVDAIYQGNSKRKFELVARQSRPHARVIAKLEFAREGDHYQVKTAGLVREKYYSKRTPLWERANPPLFQKENPSATRHASQRGQSGEQLNFTTYDSGVKSAPRGAVTIKPDGYMINLFRKADLSTLLHETGHVFFEEVELAVREGLADEELLRDYNTLRDWVGAREHAPLTVEQKERIARGFEAYLMEGKAPSTELQSSFERFKKWLLAIYRSAKRLKVELTDQVRDVFDRLISTEREIATTAARNEFIDLTRRELDALGLSGVEREYAGQLMAAAREAAAQRLARDRNRDRKERLARYAKEARQELLDFMVYQARADIRRKPLDAACVRELYGEETARALRKALPFSLKEEGGVDPEIFAAEHGFANGAAMLEQIIASPSLTQAVAERVRAKEAAHDAAFPPLDYLLETSQANEQVELVGQYLARSLGRQQVEQQAFQNIVEQELLAMPMGRAVQSESFLAAMRRATTQERRAIGQGDFAAALEANHKARLNLEFSRRSRDLAKEREVLERRIKRFVEMSQGDPAARYIVMDLGLRHGLAQDNARLRAGRDAGTVRNWLSQAEADGYTIFAEDALLYGPGRSWRELPLVEYEALADTVNQIISVERNRRRLLTDQNKAALEDVAGAIAESIYQQRSAQAVKTVEARPAALKALKGLHAIHSKVEAICLALDGDRRGPTWEHIFRPIARADDAQSLRFKEVRNTLVGPELFGAYTRQELAAMGRRKELAPEVGERLTYENRLALALNMGNPDNINRIKDGHGWSDEQIAAVLRPLTSRDWKFVQSVWDYLGTFKEEAFALQEEISGMRPSSVQATPLRVRTSEGAELQLEGGYYPIKYNSEKGFRAFMQEQKAMDSEFFGGRNYGAAMTRAGHLKERAGGGLGSPLLLELSVVTDHIFNVVHDLTYRKAVLDVAKVINHQSVRQAIESTVGPEIYRELRPWLQDVANERQEPMHAVHRWARWARASSSIMNMGFKITTALTQPLGFTQSIELLGYGWAAAGLKQVYRNPLKLPELLEETFARSAFMAGRIRSFDREVRDFSKLLRPGLGRFAWVDKIKDNAFVPMGIFQMGVDLPTWWGAYQKGLRELAGDEARAAEYADSVVRLSQGGGATKDLARVQRGGDLLRLATMFYSYFNTLYNLGARGLTALKNDHSPAGIFRAANTALLLWFVPAVLSELVAGRGPDEDDDEGWGEWAAMNLLQYPFQAVVGVRDLSNGIFGEYGYQITPAQSAPKSLVNWFKSVQRALEEEDAGEMARPTAEAVGYLFGLPMKQPIITVGNLWDYLTGEDPEFYARDLFFVKPKSRR